MKAIVDIFSGFLGAGKTMLIKKLLSEQVYKSNTVIIENEFGEVGIDGEILREANIEVKEINSGCICCQVSGNFGDAVIEVIKKYKPENIIIEPSGVAKLSEILKILKGIKFQHLIEIRNVYTLIDIKKYEIYINNFKEFYENQIKFANKIVLSRTQFVDKNMIDKTITSLKLMNSQAEVIYEPWDKLKGKDFIHDNLKNEKIKIIKRGNASILKKEINHSANQIFESYPIDITKIIDKKDLEKKFAVISKDERFGNVLRGKGIIKNIDGCYYSFDYVKDEFKIRKIKWSNKNVILIIGSKLNKKELLNIFQ